MMKHLVFLFTISLSLIFITFVFCQETKKTDDALECLGNQFIDSLKDDNIVAFAQCWISYHKLLIIDNQKKHVRELYKKALERDREIKDIFNPLRKIIIELVGDKTELKLESISIKKYMDETKQIQRAHSIIISLRVDSRKICSYEFDGVNISGSWYFVDEPSPYIDIIKDGKSKRVDVRTREEWHKL